MASKTRSIIPYYGGKARMANFIAERLNYADSDIYIEPFGGACRVLLNKPRHKIEIYNDYAENVTSVMHMLSNPKTAREFIYRLLETEYSEEQFKWAKGIVDIAEMDTVDYVGSIMEKELKQLFIKYGVISPKANKTIYKAVLKDEVLFNSLVNKIKNGKSSNKKESLIELAKLAENYEKTKSLKGEQGYIERTRDFGISISDMDLAVATYIVYTQSRDSRGEVWSSSKFKSTKQYRDNMAKLFECAERMEGVLIYEIDAMDFFRWYIGVNRDDVLDASNSDYSIMLRWIHDSKVMMYCDPSYISPKDEEKLLEGIDWENEDNISKKIKEKYKDKMPKNLGEIYAMSFNYEDQENFVKCICDAECKIMVSNYNLKLYNKYLSPENGWKRVEFKTFTSVGNKADNKRVEVLWMNY